MLKEIEKLIVHHTKSAYGCFEVIDKWHKDRGWCNPVTGISCGYNIIIPNGRFFSHSEYNPHLDGIIQPGRGVNLAKVISLDEKGAHTLGYNGKSIGVALVGNGVDTITTRQLRTLETVLRFYACLIPKLSIVGHRDVNSTQCPGFDVTKWAQEKGVGIWK